MKTGLKNSAAAENISPYIYACRHALNNALTGTDQDPELDYANVLLSQGALSRIPGVTAVLVDNEVEFSWSDLLTTQKGELTDTVCLVVYNATNRELSFSADTVRSAKTASVAIPYSIAGDTILFYLFFRSASDPVQVSTSQYLGSAEIV